MSGILYGKTEFMIKRIIPQNERFFSLLGQQCDVLS